MPAATKTMTLYHFNSCPWCLRVRWAIKRMGISLPLRNINSNPAYAEELVNGGGKRQVPCLRIDDGKEQSTWLYESADIISYLKS